MGGKVSVQKSWLMKLSPREILLKVFRVEEFPERDASLYFAFNSSPLFEQSEIRRDDFFRVFDHLIELDKYTRDKDAAAIVRESLWLVHCFLKERSWATDRLCVQCGTGESQRSIEERKREDEPSPDPGLSYTVTSDGNFTF